MRLPQGHLQDQQQSQHQRQPPSQSPLDQESDSTGAGAAASASAGVGVTTTVDEEDRESSNPKPRSAVTRSAPRRKSGAGGGGNAKTTPSQQGRSSSCVVSSKQSAGGNGTGLQEGAACNSVVVITGNDTLCVPDIYGIQRCNKMSSRWWSTASTEQHTQLAAQQLELGRIETTAVSPQNTPSLEEPNASRRICANQKHRPGVSYDARTRKRQLYLHNFLERPRGWRAILYHLCV